MNQLEFSICCKFYQSLLQAGLIGIARFSPNNSTINFKNKVLENGV